jgi:hypothetical protein
MNNQFFTFLKDKNSYQKGVVLLVTFIIMGIVVAIVLGVSIILVSELKMIRGMGNSVVAFYTADSGIEKTLYYDNKEIPDNGSRGVCNICSSCSSESCQNCKTTGSGCQPTNCTECQVYYETVLNDKIFKMVVVLAPELDDVYGSYGMYKDVTRAIEIKEGAEIIPCGGYYSDDHCWYAGTPGQSCNQVCAEKGGVADSDSILLGCMWKDPSCGTVEHLLGVTCSICTTNYCPSYYFHQPLYSECGRCTTKEDGAGCDYGDPDTTFICACKN